MKKELHKDLFSLSHKLGAAIQMAKKHYDVEDIHELRTGFKKIRALLRWQKAHKVIYADLKKIYAVAGELRNIQVVQQVTETDPLNLDSFQNWLSCQMNNIKRKLGKTSFKKPMDRFYNRIENISLYNKKTSPFLSAG